MLVGALTLATIAGLSGAPAEAKRLITGRDIANQTITRADIGPGGVGSSEIADNSVSMRDLASSTRKNIQRRRQAGNAIYGSVASGRTVYGAIGGAFDNTRADSKWTQIGGLPFPTPAPGLSDADVTVSLEGAYNPDGLATTTDGPGVCAGSAEVPTAPRGSPVHLRRGAQQRHGGRRLLRRVGRRQPQPFGFELYWNAPSTGASTAINAVWAYTAPYPRPHAAPVAPDGGGGGDVTDCCDHFPALVGAG